MNINPISSNAASYITQTKSYQSAPSQVNKTGNDGDTDDAGRNAKTTVNSSGQVLGRILDVTA